MLSFQLRDGVLHVESVPLPEIVTAVGTPAYVYSTAAFRSAARAFKYGLTPVVRKHLAFAVKANPNLAVLRLLAAEGYGADMVSGGEMLRALAAGIAPRDIIFSGAGKTDRELAAALDAGVGQFNLELEEEGLVLSALAEARGMRASAVLRVNPDIDAGSHAKISTGRRAGKFGVGIDQAAAIFGRLVALMGLDLRGIAIHIGSQLVDIAPLEAAYVRVGDLLGTLRGAGYSISHVDLGGGLGSRYRLRERVLSPVDYGAMAAPITRDWQVNLMFEPGRFVAGEAGVLRTKVLWIKPGDPNPYVIVDAAMNDLARPALYGAYHEFVAVAPRGGRIVANIAGPVCESGDTFAMARTIDPVERSDLAVFETAGAWSDDGIKLQLSRAGPESIGRRRPFCDRHGSDYAGNIDGIAAFSRLAEDRRADAFSRLTISPRAVVG